MSKKKFYITTPLYYVNADPHIGHSYTQIAVDALARFRRLAGDEVYFLTGTDEHGDKIEKAAVKDGYEPGREQEFVDKIHDRFVRMWNLLDISYDGFIRTTEDYHKDTVKFILGKVNKKGDIYKKKYDGYYCTPCEMFWAGFQVEGGICPDCRREVDPRAEDNYFFRLSRYQEWLMKYIDEHPDFVKPQSRRNEVLGILKSEKLIDLCISRPKSRLKWGVEIPFDPDYVTYVWFDALINYISGIGYPEHKRGFNRHWPADFHFIGKDIIRQHAIYWPIMLYAADLEPPRTVFAHGWWVAKGVKMSKSRGNIIDPKPVIEQYGADVLRYFLLREVSFGLDGIFSDEAFVRRYNSDLANDLGNLLNRTLTMVEKYVGGAMPAEAVPEKTGNGPFSKLTDGLRAGATALYSATNARMQVPAFNLALDEIWSLVGLANKYIEEVKPWTLAKEGKSGDILMFLDTLLRVLATVAVFVYPFIPKTSEKIWKQLGMEGSPSDKRLPDTEKWDWIDLKGHKVNKGAPLFPRI